MGVWMKIYGLKNCDTCRKALKSLSSAELVDVRVDGISSDLLVRALDEFGNALLNTRSTTWRNLNEDARQGDPLTLLKQHPALMKRPLIMHEDRLFLGWGKDVQALLLG